MVDPRGDDRRAGALTDGVGPGRLRRSPDYERRGRDRWTSDRGVVPARAPRRAAGRGGDGFPGVSPRISSLEGHRVRALLAHEVVPHRGRVEHVLRPSVLLADRVQPDAAGDGGRVPGRSWLSRCDPEAQAI